jgi:hypothetical protein
MRTLTGLFFLLASVVAQAKPMHHGCLPNNYKEAEALLETVLQHERSGSATSVDRPAATAFVLETKYCAGVISKTEMCAELPELMNALVSRTRVRHELGMATVDDVIARLRKQNEVEKRCSPSGH